MDLQAPLTLPVLAALVLTAVVCDLRARRIPNALVVVGIVLGLFIQTVAPAGGCPRLRWVADLISCNRFFA